MEKERRTGVILEGGAFALSLTRGGLGFNPNARGSDDGYVTTDRGKTPRVFKIPSLRRQLGEIDSLRRIDYWFSYRKIYAALSLSTYVLQLRWAYGGPADPSRPTGRPTVS